MNYRRLYEYRFRNVDQSAREAVWREIARHLHEHAGRPARVLDPAAGRGEFIRAVPAAERWAVDAVAHDELDSDPNVTLIVSDIFAAELPDDYFDAVFVSNFLEHLPAQEAVADFLEQMLRCMRTRGRLVVLGPNFRYCAKEYFDCADHTLALTHVAVAEHLYAAGFEIERVVPRFLPYSFRSGFPATAALTRRYLRTPALWRVLGQQFLVTGQKRFA
jgi:ubiquinone/menaquinone biosynthesis C-methylase UbiE